MILCCDDYHTWRKEIFPYYKVSRKHQRQLDDVDWPVLLKIISQVKEELKENFHRKVIQVKNAEADDIIATIIKLNPDTKIIIASSDKDFNQLISGNVARFDNKSKKLVEDVDAKSYLKEHIFRGDSGDSIPNILTKDDYFLVREKGHRQKTITKKMLEKWETDGYEESFDETTMDRFKRNKKLIDLSEIPPHIESAIAIEFQNSKPKPFFTFSNYLIKNKLKTMYEKKQDFL
jgi:5'-3' exonuclease